MKYKKGHNTSDERPIYMSLMINIHLINHQMNMKKMNLRLKIHYWVLNTVTVVTTEEIKSYKNIKNNSYRNNYRNSSTNDNYRDN